MLLNAVSRNELFVQNTIVTYIVNRHTGKESQISYAKLRKDLNEMVLSWTPDPILSDLHKYVFKSKDECRAYVNKAFEKTNYTLLFTAKGIFVARNNLEIVQCAKRLKNHALGELRRYSKLMSMPQNAQIVVDFDCNDIRLIDAYTREHLEELDRNLLEISKDREYDV